MGFGDEIVDGPVPPASARRWSFLRDIPRVLPYFRPYWKFGVASFLVIGVGAAASLLTPWPLAIVIDVVAGEQTLPIFDSWNQTTIIVVAVLAGFVLTALQHGVGVLGDYVDTKLAQHMTLDLRSRLFQHVQGLSQTFHDEARSGALAYAVNHAAMAAGQITVAFPPLAQSLLTLIGMFVIVFTMDPVIALVSLTVIPFVYASTGFYTKRIEPQLYSVRNIEHTSLTIVFEAMKMLRVIVAFGREGYEYGRFRDWAERGLKARVELTVRQSAFSMAVSLITAAGTALVLGLGAMQVIQGQLTPGELLVMMAYIGAVYAPLHTISGTLTALQDHVISLRMALDLLEREPEVRESPNAVALDRVAGHVAYRDVTFAYPGRAAALENVSFDVRPGEKIGVVGPTGAGKTTLVSLLPRFYDTHGGQIMLDGIDVRELTLDSLRRSISVVHQEALLFSGTIAFNIGYGRFEATDEELVAAAQAANAHDFVQRFPQGYETELGEGGRQLSGGERQRIAIARAFLKDAPVLVLDEPTASVDSRTESLILDALDRLMEGRTTFIVAHRLSTLRNVDSIIVLDRGRIVERGTHDELLDLDGLYAQFHRAQARPDSRPAPVPVTMVEAASSAGFSAFAPDDQVFDVLPSAEAAAVDADATRGDSTASAVTDVERRVSYSRTPSPREARRKATPSARRPKVVVLGAMSRMPVAGIVWLTMPYLVGLERLGYEVYYVEAHARAPSMLMEREDDDGSTSAAGFIDSTLRRFDLGGRWAFHALHDDGRVFGLSERRLGELFRSAALIINLHGATMPLPEHSASGRLVYLETDPVGLEIELHHGDPHAKEFLEQHSAFFTWGENYGGADCRVPLPDGVQFRPTRAPVLLDAWELEPVGPRTIFTTVGNWRQQARDVTFEGETYHWSKHHEFLKLIDLPRHTTQPLELALSGHEDADRRRLEANGWRVRDALRLSADIDAYRRYIVESRGEFTVAKDQNIRLRSGWFSDRSATYLAAGLPVVTQDTGFGNILPTGAGLFAFSTREEVVDSLEAINGDYLGHSHAAREIAREYFDADVVLGRFLRELGLPVAQGHRLIAPARTAATFPSDLVLTPVSRWPTVLPPETVERVCSAAVPDSGANASEVDMEIETSIVIVTYDTLPFTRLCLESVLGNTGEPCEIIVVDNGSTDGTAEYLRTLALRQPRIRVIQNQRNLGFAPAVNSGLAAAKGAVLVLLNNDTIVPPEWLAGLRRHLWDPGLGLIGAVSNRAATEAEIEVDYETYGELLAFAAERAGAYHGVRRDTDALTLFCAAMRSEVYEEVGPLDERYEVGLFEDDDFVLRVRGAGYAVARAEDVFVHHFGQASIGKLAAAETYGPLFDENRARFEAKWDVVWKPHRRRMTAARRDLEERARELLGEIVPAGMPVLVVSKGDEGLVELDGPAGWHFPQTSDGVYAGFHPADSADAIAHLEELRGRGGRYLFVPLPSLWWLDFYADFRVHLEREYRLLRWDADAGALFSLDAEPPAEAAAAPSSVRREAR